MGVARLTPHASGPVDTDHRARILRALGVDLGSADAVLGVVPDIAAFTDLKVTVLGRWDPATAAKLGTDVEVRAVYADGREFGEDPVTGGWGRPAPTARTSIRRPCCCGGPHAMMEP